MQRFFFHLMYLTDVPTSVQKELSRDILELCIILFNGYTIVFN